MKFFTFLSITFVLLLNTIAQERGRFTDPRDGKTYKTVKIGEQTWMAENLNYETDNSFCYDNNSANCDIYGRLYDWSTAKSVCPSGWSLPSMRDNDTLFSTLNSITAATYIVGGRSGFNALMGGFRCSKKERFRNIKRTGLFWISEEFDTNRAWYLPLRIGYGAIATGCVIAKSDTLSVRCIMDKD